MVRLNVHWLALIRLWEVKVVDLELTRDTGQRELAVHVLRTADENQPATGRTSSCTDRQDGVDAGLIDAHQPPEIQHKQTSLLLGLIEPALQLLHRYTIERAGCPYPGGVPTLLGPRAHEPGRRRFVVRSHPTCTLVRGDGTHRVLTILSQVRVCRLHEPTSRRN